MYDRENSLGQSNLQSVHGTFAVRAILCTPNRLEHMKSIRATARKYSVKSVVGYKRSSKLSVFLENLSVSSETFIAKTM